MHISLVVTIPAVDVKELRLGNALVLFAQILIKDDIKSVEGFHPLLVLHDICGVGHQVTKGPFGAPFRQVDGLLVPSGPQLEDNPGHEADGVRRSSSWESR